MMVDVVVIVDVRKYVLVVGIFFILLCIVFCKFIIENKLNNIIVK